MVHLSSIALCARPRGTRLKCLRRAAALPKSRYGFVVVAKCHRW
jgi:hypothetical protein